MGRKDASSQRGAPIEQYRKQLGKHDNHEMKKDVKLVRAKVGA
jgi:hypothetical protein